MIGQELVIRLRSQFHHLVQFLLQSRVIRADLSNHLISIQTEHKLRLAAYSIMLGDLRRDITVYLDHLQESVFPCERSDMLIGGLTLRVPVGTEVDQGMCVFVLQKMGV